MTSTLRVLHGATGNLYGGVEVFLHTLARHQPATAVSDFSVCWGEGRLARQLRGAGARVHDLGEVRLSRPWQVWRARRRLGAVLRRERFDVAVLHSGWTHLLFGPVLRRAGLPIIMGVHTLVPRHSRLERWARRIPLAGVFANSRFTAESARNWYPGCPDPRVILLPVESPAAAGERASAALRESLRTPLEDCVILQASRLQSLKGQRTLLQALAAMRTVPGWTCWLAGGAQRPEEQAFLAELQALAAASGVGERIRFLGQRDDVPSLLEAADVVCQVNEDPEAFGLIYVEALAAGKPVIAANRGGVTEVVDAGCGALIPPGAAGVLADTLQQWVANPQFRQQLGRAGVQRARECCDVDRQIAALHHFLGECSGNARLRR